MALVVPEVLPRGDAAQADMQLHSLIQPFWSDYYGLLGANINATSWTIHKC